MAALEESLRASMRALGPRSDPATCTVRVSGRVDPEDAVQMGAQMHQLLISAKIEMVICDVAGLVDPDAAALDAICRMRLAARQAGSGLQIRNASHDLQDLLDLIGLSEIVPKAAGSGLEP